MTSMNIVERLRATASNNCHDAADEIERLRAALAEIAPYLDDACRAVIRRALGGKMTDIVERLREHIVQPEGLMDEMKLMGEAADEIERLWAANQKLLEQFKQPIWSHKREIERLRAALQYVASYPPGGDAVHLADIARRTLEGK